MEDVVLVPYGTRLVEPQEMEVIDLSPTDLTQTPDPVVAPPQPLWVDPTKVIPGRSALRSGKEFRGPEKPNYKGTREPPEEREDGRGEPQYRE